MPRHVRILLFLAAAIGACARPGTLSTSGPFDIARTPDEGLRYFVTRDLLTVDAKISQFHQVVRGRGGVCELHDSLATSWTLTVTTVPDRRQAYRLGLTPSGIVDQTLGVKVSETGVLTSLNYAGADQRAAIVTTVAKGVAGVLGAVTRGGLGAARDTSCATPSKAKPTPVATRHVIRTFDLTELPPAPDAAATWPTIAREHATYTRDLELFTLASLFVTVSPIPEPTSALEPASNAKGAAIGCTGSDSVCATIHFREPVMRVIRVHVADAIDPRNTTFSIGEERIVPLVSAADPILNISFGTQVLGAGKIGLTFGAHGNVTGIEQSSSAALNGAASAAVSAAEGAHAAYDAALKARVDELDLEIKAAKDNATLKTLQSSDTSTSTP
ncbi:MAG: hypothetical protein JJD97_08540 [Gemmatimonadaceae bacterium]|nr:hypothetical protein [Gemmatimonadaceae bacterium]